MDINFTMERTATWDGVDYRVLEVLTSDHLLVVKNEDYENNVYPMPTYVIPGR